MAQARSVFRGLLRARAAAFQGDAHALRESSQKLRDEFSKTKGVTDQAQLGATLHFANAISRGALPVSLDA